MMNKTIVIMSNDILFTQLFETLLYRKIKGVKIVVCKSIQEIKEKVLVDSASLGLLDSILNGISSLEVIRYLRMERHIVSPLFYFSDIQIEAYTYKAYEMGASRIIHRPFDPNVITDQIVELINSY